MTLYKIFLLFLTKESIISDLTELAPNVLIKENIIFDTLKMKN